MNSSFKFLIFITLVLAPLYLVSQKVVESRYCYTDTISDSSEVFTRMENKPHFKGGHDSLLNYLMENISFKTLVNDLRQNERIFEDTARIKCIISREGIMSNLTVTRTKKQLYQNEILRVFKNSACSWKPGDFGRYVTGWLQLDIYYLIDRRYNEITTKVKVKEYSYATD